MALQPRLGVFSQRHLGPYPGHCSDFGADARGLGHRGLECPGKDRSHLLNTGEKFVRLSSSIGAVRVSFSPSRSTPKKSCGHDIAS